MCLEFLKRTLAVSILLCVMPSVSRAAEKVGAEKATLASPYVFTDEDATVQLAGPAPAELPYELKTITRQGFGPVATGNAHVENGAIHVKPLVEGLHILQLGSTPPQTVRFLAMAPPPALDTAALRRALPLSARKLLAGAPFKILSMGDSVTHTGDYESMLVKMLARATGDRNISFVDRSYSGRSVDASVREWQNDGPPTRPDLGLIMYGLNDQITNVPLDAFLEQYAWLTRQLKGIGADSVWLQPTPDIGIPVTDEDRKPDSNPPSYIVRTLGFGEALRPLAAELKLPVAETFASVWGNGGSSLEASARSMWPLFPPGYANQFASLIENAGKGDTIHLNALGHLQIARAVFNALNGAHPVAPWQWSAQTRWTPRGAVSTLTARNVSQARRTGRLEIVAPSDAVLDSAPVTYDLAPGQSVQTSVLWTQAKQPADLLAYPANRYLALETPLVPVVDFSGETGSAASHVTGVRAPFEAQVAFKRTRYVVNGNRLEVEYTVDGKKKALPVEIPANSEVGRIPILRQVQGEKASAWLAGEIAYVRYGAARSGEAVVDGDLAEWDNAVWAPLGEPVQARSWRGPQDNRATPQEAYLRWAFKAGKGGLYLASHTTGDMARDTFTLFFDTRSPDLLGTVGRYYWVSGKLLPDGRLHVEKGETSATAPGLTGSWKKTATGVDLELFVPYAALDTSAWPRAGDLGLSIIWTHFDAADNHTDLLWSENGHWWNPRWYGVVRRTDAPTPSLPYRVRVN